jgi:tellurium resistance protein TerZ
MIENKSFFGFGSSKEEIDLDASCAVFDKDNNLLETIYYGNLHSYNNSIKHSGDDLTGAEGDDDGLDNEIIYVDLKRLSQNADQIVFILNSFREHDFADIPYATIRLYEGTFTKVNEVIASFGVANDRKFKGNVSMIMGKLYKQNNE